jgi:transcriptional regulator with XRE-family HTH domain
MHLFRIGDKLVSRPKIDRAVDRILDLRYQGLSQQEVANKLRIDRTFVSRLERLGEVRKGKTLAIVGLPVGNKEEIEQVAREEGADYTLLMTDKERWDFVKGRDGLAVLNDLMRIINQVRQYDTVIIMASDMRLGLMRSLLDKEVLTITLGQSPIIGDVRVDPEMLREMLRAIRSLDRTSPEKEGFGS